MLHKQATNDSHLQITGLRRKQTAKCFVQWSYRKQNDPRRWAARWPPSRRRRCTVPQLFSQLARSTRVVISTGSQPSLLSSTQQRQQWLAKTRKIRGIITYVLAATCIQLLSPRSRNLNACGFAKSKPPKSKL
jgi:hypothetical protein